MKVPFLDLKWQQQQIASKLEERWRNILANTSFINGPDVSLFEDNFAAYLGVSQVIGVANGTDALTLAIESLELQPDDEIITLATSFIATASAILHAGNHLVFAEMDLETRGFDFVDVRRKITPKTKAIIPVHLYGQPEDMEQVMKLAEEFNLFVIEDACQAHGAEYFGKKVGTIGDLGCFSFYPGKNLGAYGDGGAIVTNNDVLAGRVKKLRNHGGIAKYEHQILGYNSRLDSLQAAVLDEKLKLLDDWNGLRRKAADIYYSRLVGVPGIKTYPVRRECLSVHHLFIISLEGINREAFMKHLTDNGIGCGIHYPDALPVLPALAQAGYQSGDFPRAEAYCGNIVSLPMYPGITDEQVNYVCDIIADFIANEAFKESAHQDISEPKKIRVGVIGFGYWGPNLVRNFFSSDLYELCWIIDSNENNLHRARVAYPEVKASSDYRDLINDNSIDLAAIATPIETHYFLAKDALLAGKHVFIEKPFTSTVAEAEELVELARVQGKKIAVDHTFLYSAPVKKVKALIDSGELGQIYYIDASRLNLGLIQRYHNVFWDLAVHDLAIIDYFFDKSLPVSLRADGINCTASGLEEFGILTLRYPGNKTVKVTVSWISPVKIRNMYVVGSQKMVQYDDIHPDEKIKIFDKRIEYSQIDDKTHYPTYRSGDVVVPRLDNKETLAAEVQELHGFLAGQGDSKTTGEDGLRIVRILEAIQESLKTNQEIIL